MKMKKRPDAVPDMPEEGAGRTADAFHSVLTRRAVCYTLILLIVAGVVGMAAGRIADRTAVIRNAEARVRETAAHVNGGDVVSMGGVQAAGMRLTVTDGQEHAGDAALTESDGENLLEALTGGEKLYTIEEEGREFMRLMTPYAPDATRALVVDMPTDGVPGSGASAWWGVIAGFIAACAASLPLKKLILDKPLDQYTARLHAVGETARKVAAGDLTAQADETVPGEPGELAAGLNEISRQLAHNMSTLIVERNRLKNMLDGLNEGIIAVDAQGGVTHINPAVSELFEQREVSVGLPDPRMKYVPSQEVWTDFDSVIAGGEPAVRTFNSRDMVIRLSVTPIVDELGAIAGAVGLFSDITQSERLEKTRREYVSNVSHELRTPLTAVRALIEPLKEGMVRDEADRMRYYDIILREVMRLSRLINDQLELSRLQSGSVAIMKQRMTLDDLVYDVCDRFRSIAADKGLELKLATELDDCPAVWSNPDRVEQMLVILVDNAIKYTEEGSVTVSLDWGADVVRISVADTGVGIGEADLPHVFDRFYKVDKAHSGKGSGLGLSIAKELLDRMGEKIEVKSTKGKGTTFTFTVHRKQPQTEE